MDPLNYILLKINIFIQCFSSNKYFFIHIRAILKGIQSKPMRVQNRNLTT